MVIGEVKDYGDARAKGMVRPPAVDPANPRILFDSICGTEDSIGTRYHGHHEFGKQFVVYDRHQAYPHFLFDIVLPVEIFSVWGVNGAGNIYKRAGVAGQWEQVPGRATCVAVGGPNGEHVWHGAWSSADIYYMNTATNGSWQKVSGGLDQIAVGGTA